MDPNLAAAVTGAQNIQAPASPLGASNAPELAKLFASSFRLPLANALTGAQAKNAEVKVKSDEEAQKIAQQKAQDMADIKAYKIVKKGDGGYDFFDPTGKQVDIATLAQRTGVNPADVVKDSENPIDIQYTQDYGNLQGYIKAVLSGDKKSVQAYQDSDPALKQYNDRGGVDRLIQDFRNHYQRYYVTRAVNPSAWGAAPGGPLVTAPQGNSSGVGTPSL